MTHAPPAYTRLQAAQTLAWLSSHPQALILDARQAQHHELAPLPQSVHLDGRNHERMLMREPKDRPVFIYCYHGHASQTYAQMFVDFGFERVADLIGGHEAWLAHLLGSQAAAGPNPSPGLQAWLSEQGYPDVFGRDKHGNTPLMRAAWTGQTRHVEELIAQGSDLQATNMDGNNVVWLACVSNQADLVSLVITAGANVNHQNATGATALMYAASSDKPEMVRTLLALGADPMLQTQDDYLAMDMAAGLTCLQLLRRADKRTSPPAELA